MSETNIPSVDDKMKALMAKFASRQGWGPHDIYADLLSFSQIMSETRFELGRLTLDVRHATAEPQHIARIDDVLDGVIRRAKLNDQRESSANSIAEPEALPENERDTRCGAGSWFRGLFFSGHVELIDHLYQRIGIADGQFDAAARAAAAATARADLADTALAAEREAGVRSIAALAAMTARAERAEAELRVRGEHLETAGRVAAAATTRAEMAEAAVDGLGRESELLIQGRAEQLVEIERLRSELAHWYRALCVAVGLDPDAAHGQSAGWEGLVDGAAEDHKIAESLKKRPFEMLHDVGYRLGDSATVGVAKAPVHEDGIDRLVAEFSAVIRKAFPSR